MNFLSTITGSFAMPAAENPTVAMMDAAYGHHGIDARYINCEVPPEKLADAVRGARATRQEWRICTRTPRAAPTGGRVTRQQGQSVTTGCPVPRGRSQSRRSRR